MIETEDKCGFPPVHSLNYVLIIDRFQLNDNFFQMESKARFKCRSSEIINKNTKYIQRHRNMEQNVESQKGGGNG